MEFKTNGELSFKKEPIYLNEIIYDGQTEQGVEFDYVLPDYYPDIFKILKCTVTPKIISYSVSGTQPGSESSSKLFMDGVVYIKALYIAAGGGNSIKTIEHRYTYSKTIDLGRNCPQSKPAENPIVNITPKTDYCNCRAVSGRRIDVRGAVSCKIKVNCPRETEMITDAAGMKIETKKSSLVYCGEKLSASSRFVSREDIETGMGKSGNISIVHHDESVQLTEFKVIANKVMIKGEVQIKSLYISNNDNIPGAEQSEINSEVMEAEIPISKMIDLEGVTDRHTCYVNLSILDCDLEVKPQAAGDTSENRIFSCDITLSCDVIAHLERNVSPVTDIYSTDYETSFSPQLIKAETLPQIINEQLTLKSSVENGEGFISEVYDTRCDISNIVCRARGENELVLTGQANYFIIGKLEGGLPAVAEKAEPFELTIPVAGVGTDYSVEPNLQVTSTAYSITSDNHVDVRANLSLRACLYKIISVQTVKDIIVNPDKPKEKNSDYALKLYYADENENIWDIAKRYNTSSSAIIAENDISAESGKTEFSGMLLIPIV